MTLNRANDAAPGRLIGTLEGGRGCMPAFSLILDFGDTEDPDFKDLKSGMDLECGANLSSEAFCRMIGAVDDVDDVDDFGESCARICRPAAGRAVFITHTNEFISVRVEASKLHREHKRWKRDLLQGGCASARMVRQFWLPGARVYFYWTRESWWWE
jgi:hypothetical protein